MTQLSEQQQHGIVTDLARLLRCRHWARDLKLFSAQAARSMLLGDTRSRFRGRGMEFEEVRRYQPGDDIRTIDWKVSARAGKTYTKLFCEERERPVHIMVDQRSSLFFGSQQQFKSVLAAELACALGWAALAGSDRVGAQVIGDHEESESRAKRNKQAVLRLIHDVHQFNHALLEQAHTQVTHNATQALTYNNGTVTSLANSLEECRRITRPGTAIFIISDFHDFDDHAARALRNLSKGKDITLIKVVDALEQELPLLSSAPISDGVQRSRISINSNLKNAYQQHIDERQSQLKVAATKAKAQYTQIDTSQTARQSLRKLFAT